MHLKCKDWRRFWRKKQIHKCPNGHVMAIQARSPKTRIFLKSAKGGPGAIFQKSPKKQPSFERPKSTLAQMVLSSNQHALKLQRLEKIQPETTAPNVPEWLSYGNFLKVTQKPHFLKKCKGEPRKIFQKSPKTQPSFQRPKSSLVKMALSANQYALKLQKLEKILPQKAASKLPEWPSYGNFCKVTQDPHFLKKYKGRTKGNFSQIAKKVELVWKAQKHSGAKTLSSIQYGLEVQGLDNIQAQKAAPKVLEWPSYGNFGKVTQNPHFLKKYKGGIKGNFSKIAIKVDSFERPQSTLAQMALSSYQNALKGQRLENILGQKSGSKSSRMTKLLQFWQGHPKPAFSEKVERGDQGKFFKNRPKSSPR